MPAQLKTVQRARKPQGNCAKCKTELPAGSAYRYYRPGFHSRVKVRVCMSPACTPNRSELESSRMSDAYAAVEDAEAAITDATSIEEITTALEECASRIREVADEYQASVDERPMLEDSLSEKIEMLNDFATNLESVSLDDESDEPKEPAEPQISDFDDEEEYVHAYDTWKDELVDFKSQHEDWLAECSEALENAKDAANDALSELE